MREELETLRRLKRDLPASPGALAELLDAVRRDDFHADLAAEIIRRDMALSSAVIRAVNTAMYGLLRRVQTVGEALRYLGTERVLALTCEVALRQAFPATPLLDRIWRRASWTGLLTAEAATRLRLDAFLAHSAGLFAHAGMAVMAAYLPERYGELHERHGNDPLRLSEEEHSAFGLSHPALGSAMCAAWGLAPEVVRCVRSRGWRPARWRLLAAPERTLCVIGLLGDRSGPEGADQPDQDGMDGLEGLSDLGVDITACRAAIEHAWARLSARRGRTLSD